jgi:hypothetical protein
MAAQRIAAALAIGRPLLGSSGVQQAFLSLRPS